MSHGSLLRQQSCDPELSSHVMHDYRNANLDAETRGILDFASQLTRDQTSMEESNVQGLRGLRLSDEYILLTVLITCIFNFMTRLTDGLGVEFPQRMQKAIEG